MRDGFLPVDLKFASVLVSAPPTEASSVARTLLSRLGSGNVLQMRSWSKQPFTSRALYRKCASSNRRNGAGLAGLMVQQSALCFVSPVARIDLTVPSFLNRIPPARGLVDLAP
jgi:hypothetical protein